ncbi:hypothetical protein OAO87_02010 [bacterium]|nr:hypothetical protein [bacterium]
MFLSRRRILARRRTFDSRPRILALGRRSAAAASRPPSASAAVTAAASSSKAIAIRAL